MTADGLPPDPALLIRGGHVLTMDPALGDFPGGDVLVAGGQIAAVGPGLGAPGAEVLDARGMIVAPGLVDTHWHMWNTLLRSMSSGDGYFRLTVRLGQAFQPEDSYHGTRLACAEAINSGITTVHDWCHNLRGPGHAEAGLRALTEAGLRARFSYGYPAGPNLGVVTDPAQMLVAAAQPANVHTVLVGGRFLKRDGVLVTLDARQVSAGARAALSRVLAAG